MSDKLSPSLDQAIRQVLAQVDGPVKARELSDRVLALRPSKARNPLASLRDRLRMEHVGHTLVFLDPQTVVPLRLAMLKVCFRVPLSRQEVSRGVLLIQPAFDYFLHRHLEPSTVRLEDQAGRPLPVHLVSTSVQTETPFGAATQTRIGFELGSWFSAHQVRRDDSILVTIQDWEAGTFRLQHEPSNRRRAQEIARKDRELADLLYGMLEAAQTDVLDTHVAIPTAYARLPDPTGYPGNHWLHVLARDPRMAFDGWLIRYRDAPTPMQRILGGEGPAARVSFSPAEGRQVYRFKAALLYRPGIWRTIEIRGQQTLAEFDRVLREAFEHDRSDHLSGFWRLIRRGRGKRFRQVDLGSLDPFGEGEAADLRVAGLGLSPGDRLKYVYDFGDWIEHRINLEEIAAPEPGANYPRIAARNPPQYQNCVSCLAQGRTVRATWICYDCSDAQRQEMLICEECLEADHEDHHVEEILY